MPVTRRLRWVFIGGAAALVLLVVAILVPFLVPVDRFRPLIVRLAEAATGRTVEVGALHLHLLPSLHLEIAGLHIENPQGFPPGDTLAIQSVDVDTTVSSLLARRLDVTRVSLNGVQVNLLRTAGGKTNYEFPNQLQHAGATGSAAGQNAKSAPRFALNQIDAVIARRVKITSGTYDPRTRHVAPLVAIDGLNAGVSGIRLGAPNWMDAVTIATNLRGLTVSSPALPQPLQIQRGSLSIKGGAVDGTLTAALGTLRADWIIKIANLKNPVADVDVSIPELDLGSLTALATGGGLGMSPTARPSGPRRLLARGRIRVGQVVGQPINAKTVAAQITVYTDRAELTAYSFSTFGGTVRGTGTVNYGVEPRAAATFQARGVDLGAARRALAGMQPGIGGRVDVDGRIATALRPDPISAVTAAGTFTLRDGTMPPLSKPLQIPHGTFNVQAGRVRGTFVAALDTMTAQGSVTVANLRNPLVDFDIAVPNFDLDRMGSLAKAPSGGTGRNGGGAPPSAAGGRLMGNGVVKIGRLRAQPLELSAVTCRLRVYMDRVAVDSYALSAYGGTAQGTAVVAYTAPRVPAQGTAQLRGVNVRALQAALAPGGTQHITGTLEGAGRLATTVMPDPLAALSGTGTFAIRNGTLPGLDLPKMFGKIASIARVASGGPTKFRYFGGDFRIAGQRVYSNSLELDSDALQATGRGSAGFDQTLDYAGNGIVKGTTLSTTGEQLGNLPVIGKELGSYGSTMRALGGYTARVPFSLKGTFGNPKLSATGVPQISQTTAPAQQPSQQPPPPGQNPFQLPQLPQLPFHP